MNSQLIAFIQVLIAAVFIIWILSRRGGTPKPTILNMANDINENKSKSKIKNYSSINFTDGPIVKVKVLNVIFMWNGHNWDAYEVFGLPAGSSVEKVREKFNELKSKSDQGQVAFLTEALNAIENKTEAS